MRGKRSFDLGHDVGSTGFLAGLERGLDFQAGEVVKYQHCPFKFVFSKRTYSQQVVKVQADKFSGEALVALDENLADLALDDGALDRLLLHLLLGRVGCGECEAAATVLLGHRFRDLFRSDQVEFCSEVRLRQLFQLRSMYGDIPAEAELLDLHGLAGRLRDVGTSRVALVCLRGLPLCRRLRFIGRLCRLLPPIRTRKPADAKHKTDGEGKTGCL